MSETLRRVITQRGTPIINEDNKAGEIFKPGHLLNFSGSDLVKNTGNAANVARAFALERDEFGNDIDSAYAVGDVVKVGVFHGGQRVLAFTPSGQNLAKGARLEADNGGRLVVFSSGAVLGRVLEAANNSAGPSDMRILVEII